MKRKTKQLENNEIMNDGVFTFTKLLELFVIFYSKILIKEYIYIK